MTSKSSEDDPVLTNEEIEEEELRSSLIDFGITEPEVQSMSVNDMKELVNVFNSSKLEASGDISMNEELEPKKSVPNLSKVKNIPKPSFSYKDTNFSNKTESPLKKSNKMTKNNSAFQPEISDDEEIFESKNKSSTRENNNSLQKKSSKNNDDESVLENEDSEPLKKDHNNEIEKWKKGPSQISKGIKFNKNQNDSKETDKENIFEKLKKPLHEEINNILKQFAKTCKFVKFTVKPVVSMIVPRDRWEKMTPMDTSEDADETNFQNNDNSEYLQTSSSNKFETPVHNIRESHERAAKRKAVNNIDAAMNNYDNLSDDEFLDFKKGKFQGNNRNDIKAEERDSNYSPEFDNTDLRPIRKRNDNKSTVTKDTETLFSKKPAKSYAGPRSRNKNKKCQNQNDKFLNDEEIEKELFIVDVDSDCEEIHIQPKETTKSVKSRKGEPSSTLCSKTNILDDKNSQQKNDDSLLKNKKFESDIDNDCEEVPHDTSKPGSIAKKVSMAAERLKFNNDMHDITNAAEKDKEEQKTKDETLKIKERVSQRMHEIEEKKQSELVKKKNDKEKEQIYKNMADNRNKKKYNQANHTITSRQAQEDHDITRIVNGPKAREKETIKPINCPLCFKTFPTEEIEEHASNCNGEENGESSNNQGLEISISP